MTDFAEEEGVPAHRRDVAGVLNKMERAYLAALRTLALIVATLLLLYAAWLGATGLYKVSRNAASVKEVPASVTTEDVVDVDLKSTAAGAAKAPDPFKRERAFYQDFTNRYFNLYQTKFAPFLQANDAKTSKPAFESRYLHVGDRLEAIKQGALNFETDKGDLEGLLTGMTGAADAKLTQDRLRAYKSAKKTSVSRTINEMRSERYCSYYGYYIDQCISWDTRQVPVKRTVAEMRLPDGVISANDLFAAYHEKYVNTLVGRRSDNASRAQSARSEIVRGNAEGAESLWTAMRVVGFFVVVMFLFLLIALERHQRRIAVTRDSVA